MNDNLKSGSIQALENAMKNSRLPHGIVLESTQPQLLQQYIKKLSKWAVCKESNKPCNACSQCKKVETENHPDIYTAQLAGKTEVVNVDEIRKICNDAYIKPNEATTKVYIIPNADKMQIQAQNAFLKVLEEPPQNILFILCCTSA
ncbi:MAG: ATP-binding protein, partial [Acutalibacteraceae bacterium]|nr:ATP-binding protein [Acutalibacteraceae bacterium]